MPTIHKQKILLKDLAVYFSIQAYYDGIVLFHLGYRESYCHFHTESLSRIRCRPIISELYPRPSKPSINGCRSEGWNMKHEKINIYIKSEISTDIAHYESFNFCSSIGSNLELRYSSAWSTDWLSTFCPFWENTFENYSNSVHFFNGMNVDIKFACNFHYQNVSLIKHRSQIPQNVIHLAISLLQILDIFFLKWPMMTINV